MRAVETAATPLPPTPGQRALTRSIVLALFLEWSSHQVSHQSHSWGRDLMGTWWIMLLGRSWKEKSVFIFSGWTLLSLKADTPGRGWTDCLDLGSGPDIVLSVDLLLQSSWTSSSPPRRGRCGASGTWNMHVLQSARSACVVASEAYLMWYLRPARWLAQ